jgi:probable HAF family extracellular repeat protein
MYNRVLQRLAVAVVVFSAASALGAEFVRLGKLRPTDLFSDAYGVSVDGTTVVGISHTGARSEAVRWTFPGGIQSMGAGQPSLAYSASADGGVIVGGYVTPDGGEPFRWTQATGLVGLGDLPGGLMGGDARDVSYDGSVVVGSGSSAQGGEAFRWTAETGLVGLGLSPEGFRTIATGVSADGNVIVGYGRTIAAPGFGEQAFRWTKATGMIPLGDLPGGQPYSEALDVSADGSVVVGRSIVDGPLGFRAFRWTEETGMVSLPPVPGGANFEVAYGVSGDGNVIVGRGAFVWDAFHGSRSLEQILWEQGVDLGEFQLISARAASIDGRTIVGLGSTPRSEDEAWIARLDAGTFIPEPSSFTIAVLTATGLLGFLAWRRRCRSS